ncbi:ComEA family DNA-binding protein [Poritiphilus flavus]|uniref:ComEA family DNA-binding protein n=1 Tax=Poritiphilus flavus TaxID=2697053 RepID=UPI001EEB65C6|nr:helix-hairpin-helix domain-containing protein [Poritiphilus flavus]
MDTELHQELIQQRKAKVLQQRSAIYLFNPNFISDYKAYILGLSADELDRLRNFREHGKQVNNAREFQQVTRVSDSLLNILTPYFRFPQQKFQDRPTLNQTKVSDKPANALPSEVNRKLDLNEATAEQLRLVRGIGPKLSQRIVKFRDKLGGFMVKEQLYDVYGLEKNVVDQAFQLFAINETPEIEKLDLNTATASELAAFTYFNWEMAERIVAKRTEVGAIRSFDELPDITGLSIDKIDRIKLYLHL